MRSRLPLLTLALALVLAAPAAARGKKKHKAEADRTPGAFSYYVLSLSWSPSFCAEKADRSPEQCDGTRHYGFVVHGLWPQNEKGWPEECSTQALPPTVRDGMLDLMPSARLVEHEWAKHGTCSGLTPDDYFALVRKASEAVKRPAAYVQPKEAQHTDLAGIEARFMEANPGLTADGVSVECKKTVSEVRVCLDKELRFRPCSADTQDRCKGETLLPPVR